MIREDTNFQGFNLFDLKPVFSFKLPGRQSYFSSCWKVLLIQYKTVYCWHLLIRIIEFCTIFYFWLNSRCSSLVFCSSCPCVYKLSSWWNCCWKKPFQVSIMLQMETIIICMFDWNWSCIKFCQSNFELLNCLT